MNACFDAQDARIDGLQRTILQMGGGLIATFLIGFVSLVATQL